jgi:hypothetical protein
VMAALRHVVESQGWFATIYSDRAGHFFQTPKAGGPVDTRQLTQVGRAMKELGIRMIPAYSPQARGRSERSFGTWQGRLPQELRLRQIKTLEAANQFLREAYIAEFNRKFARPAAQTGTAFVPLKRQDLGSRVFRPTRTRCEQRQHRALGQPFPSDRTYSVAIHDGRLGRHRLRTSGWYADHWVWAAHPRRL